VQGTTSPGTESLVSPVCRMYTNSSRR
jgi:hypothetical protein